MGVAAAGGAGSVAVGWDEGVWVAAAGEASIVGVGVGNGCDGGIAGSQLTKRNSPIMSHPVFIRLPLSHMAQV